MFVCLICDQVQQKWIDGRCRIILKAAYHVQRSSFFLMRNASSIASPLRLHCDINKVNSLFRFFLTRLLAEKYWGYIFIVQMKIVIGQELTKTYRYINRPQKHRFLT